VRGAADAIEPPVWGSSRRVRVEMRVRVSEGSKGGGARTARRVEDEGAAGRAHLKIGQRRLAAATRRASELTPTRRERRAERGERPAVGAIHIGDALVQAGRWRAGALGVGVARMDKGEARRVRLAQGAACAEAVDLRTVGEVDRARGGGHVGVRGWRRAARLVHERKAARGARGGASIARERPAIGGRRVRVGGVDVGDAARVRMAERATLALALHVGALRKL
jgi:hypothetical protein